ncbi:MAG: hypothetical protein ACYDH5_13270 [Acidimicrobiales bacterium]
MTTPLAASVFLAACGGPAGPSGPPSAKNSSVPAAALCQSVAHLHRLVVRHRDAFPQNHMRFSFPSHVTVTKTASVRDAARGLCSLPKMPSGTLHCPADLGIVYHLTFSAGNRAFPAVSMGATGCQVVHGLGPARWVARSPGFWHTLGAAMGLRAPGYAAFRGSGPNG